MNRLNRTWPAIIVFFYSAHSNGFQSHYLHLGESPSQNRNLPWVLFSSFCFSDHSKGFLSPGKISNFTLGVCFWRCWSRLINFSVQCQMCDFTPLSLSETSLSLRRSFFPFFDTTLSLIGCGVCVCAWCVRLSVSKSGGWGGVRGLLSESDVHNWKPIKRA